MNELATIQTTNPFTLALQSKRILDEKKPDMMKVIMEVLPKTYYDAGQVMPGHDVKQQTVNLQVLSGALYEEIKQFFPFLKVDELKLAFRNGVRKEYGEYFGLNIVTFHTWIKGLQMDERRKESLKAIKEAKEREYAPVIGKDEAETQWKRTILSQFTNFKETGHFICEFPSFQFAEFEKRGLISLTDAEKKVIYEDAKNLLLEEKRLRRLNPKSKEELNQLSDFIKRATENNLNSNEQSAIKNAARKLAIRKLYESVGELEL